jgi:sialic acid synthase SpsE
MKSFTLGSKHIGLEHPTYFIAEIGSNFDRSLDRAKDLIWIAKEAGADCVKFQHYKAESLVSDHNFRMLRNKTHQSQWPKSVFKTYKDAELNVEWTQSLADESIKANIDFLTSPYSYQLADEVDKYVSAFKIGSGDISWLQYLDYVSKKKKPMLLATGASSLGEVVEAVNVITANNSELVLMQCNTNYTASSTNTSYTNLNVLKSYGSLFPGLVLGFSDHTSSIPAVLGAIALGARVVERHFTDDTNRSGPDHAFATDSKSWIRLIQESRELESALGKSIKIVEKNEDDARIVQRRAICASTNLPVGHTLVNSDLIYLRPCPPEALEPKLAAHIVGKKLNKPIQKYSYLMFGDIEA